MVGDHDSHQPCRRAQHGPEDDAATVVELVKRGDSWHISIRAGELYCENAEPSWEAAVACVARILGEKAGQNVDSCAEVPTAQALESLPPCRIDDPEALAKLTPARVRAYLKGKGYGPADFPTCIPWRAPTRDDYGIDEFRLQPCDVRVILAAVSNVLEKRSAAAVYLDILAAEPGA